MCELEPERVLPLIKPTVWSMLVRWFFTYRCNHIFQAACGRLWITVINHGSMQLQQLVLVKCRLLVGLCDAVLAEGACGDRWHESRRVVRRDTDGGDKGNRAEKKQVAVCRARHPGGLGGIVPVIMALADQESGVLTADQVQSLQVAAASPARQPLAERTVVPQVQAPLLSKSGVKVSAPPVQSAQKTHGHSAFVPKLLKSTSLWPQVLQAVRVAPPGAAPAQVHRPLEAVADAS
ncbi:unnamed protein product [Polarella glacialis]|uniref:Uncharacterized protein n=1 Tax=Polarella glacialis TaxID=89957 RepID=A0A813KQ75_POLGL|nr:unnamed protein product [Polarella glacialis]